MIDVHQNIKSVETIRVVCASSLFSSQVAVSVPCLATPLRRRWPSVSLSHYFL